MSFTGTNCFTLLLLTLLALPAAPGRTSAARMSMLFGGKKKTKEVKKTTSSSTSSTSSGTGYIPDGLTKAQYEKVLAEEQKKAELKKKKFPKGKQAETLTEWMAKEAQKGNTGTKLLTKGHRMVKAKYADWYVDKNEQLTRD
jgi:hypothetical protein